MGPCLFDVWGHFCKQDSLFFPFATGSGVSLVHLNRPSFIIVARAGPTNWPIVCIVTFRRKVFDMYWDLFAGRMPWLTGNTQFTKSQFVFKQKQKHRLIEFTTSCKIMTRMQPFLFRGWSRTEGMHRHLSKIERASSLKFLILSTRNVTEWETS